MHVDIIKTRIGEYIQHIVSKYAEDLVMIQIMPIDKHDPLEESPNLHDTHVKVMIDHEGDINGVNDWV